MGFEEEMEAWASQVMPDLGDDDDNEGY